MANTIQEVDYTGFFSRQDGRLGECARQLVTSSLAQTIGNVSLVSAASGLSRPPKLQENPGAVRACGQRVPSAGPPA